MVCINGPVLHTINETFYAPAIRLQSGELVWADTELPLEIGQVTTVQSIVRSGFDSRFVVPFFFYLCTGVYYRSH
jgi:hypothetical protein